MIFFTFIAMSWTFLSSSPTHGFPFSKNVRRCVGAALNWASDTVTRPFRLDGTQVGPHGHGPQKRLIHSRGDDGMYHQSALERFLRLNVRRGLWWSRVAMVERMAVLKRSDVRFGMNPIVQHIFLQSWNHFVVNMPILLFERSLCEKNDAKLKIIGPHGNDHLLLSTGWFFLEL